MPRLARSDAPGILHHVMGRGIERKKLFTNDTDRNDFIDRLAAIVEEGAMDVYAWVLMPNHVLCRALHKIWFDVTVKFKIISPKRFLASNSQCIQRLLSLSNFNRNSLLWHRWVIYPVKCLPNVIYPAFCEVDLTGVPVLK
jgi:hypothetical protein